MVPPVEVSFFFGARSAALLMMTQNLLLKVIKLLRAAISLGIELYKCGPTENTLDIFIFVVLVHATLIGSMLWRSMSDMLRRNQLIAPYISVCQLHL